MVTEKASIYYYSNLPVHQLAPEDLLSEVSNFSVVPEDWVLIVMDIEKSTQAVRYKMHRDINRIATESIMATLNEMKLLNPDIAIPFFYGGDGASLLIPGAYLQQIRLMLDDFRYHIYTNYFLNLRVGFLAIKDIYERGHAIKLARLSHHRHFSIPVALGDGLKAGERLIKDRLVNERKEPSQRMYVDTEGVSCSWQSIKFQKTSNRTLCFIVSLRDLSQQASTLAGINQKIASIFGNYPERTIFPIKYLERKNKISAIYLQQMKFPNPLNWEYLVVKVLGKYYFRWFQRGRDFAEKLSTSILPTLYDGDYADILIGTKEQIATFIGHLQMLENKGILFFGSFISHQAIIKCSMNIDENKTIYLLDGGEGGFTSAAKVIKPKMRKD